MSLIKSTIRPAPGADGPFYVVTEKDSVVTNVTLTLANLNTSLDQVKIDQAAALGGLTIINIVISTTAV